MALSRQSFCWLLAFFSGIQFLDTEVEARPSPPINTNAAVTPSASPEREESAKNVTTTGQITCVKLIIDVSKA